MSITALGREVASIAHFIDKASTERTVEAHALTFIRLKRVPRIKEQGGNVARDAHLEAVATVLARAAMALLHAQGELKALERQKRAREAQE